PPPPRIRIVSAVGRPYNRAAECGGKSATCRAVPPASCKLAATPPRNRPGGTSHERLLPPTAGMRPGLPAVRPAAAPEAVRDHCPARDPARGLRTNRPHPPPRPRRLLGKRRRVPPRGGRRRRPAAAREAPPA